MAQSWDGPEVWFTFGTGIRLGLVTNQIGKALLVEKVARSGRIREVKHRVFFSTPDFKQAVDELERLVALAKASPAYLEDAAAAATKTNLAAVPSAVPFPR